MHTEAQKLRESVEALPRPKGCGSKLAGLQGRRPQGASSQRCKVSNLGRQPGLRQRLQRRAGGLQAYCASLRQPPCPPMSWPIHVIKMMNGPKSREPLRALASPCHLKIICKCVLMQVYIRPPSRCSFPCTRVSLLLCNRHS